MVDALTRNQVRILKGLLKLNRSIPRKQFIEDTGIEPTSFHIALVSLVELVDISPTPGRGSGTQLKLTKRGIEVASVL